MRLRDEAAVLVRDRYCVVTLGKACGLLRGLTIAPHVRVRCNATRRIGFGRAVAAAIAAHTKAVEVRRRRRARQLCRLSDADSLRDRACMVVADRYGVRTCAQAGCDLCGLAIAPRVLVRRNATIRECFGRTVVATKAAHAKAVVVRRRGCSCHLRRLRDRDRSRGDAVIRVSNRYCVVSGRETGSHL